MASTISSGTLTVKLTESVSLNGSDMGATNTLTVAAITEVNQRIVSIDATNVRTLFEFGAAVGSGTYVSPNVRYIRITNKDDSNPVRINIESATSNCWEIVVAGASWSISSVSSAMDADDDTTIVAPTLQDIVKISAQSVYAIDLDCYIASI
jgi:Na+/alanine symporter